MKWIKIEPGCAYPEHEEPVLLYLKDPIKGGRWCRAQFNHRVGMWMLPHGHAIFAADKRAKYWASVETPDV